MNGNYGGVQKRKTIRSFFFKLLLLFFIRDSIHEMEVYHKRKKRERGSEK
jgi:hypothetical protein